jgi:hypothetical protein
MNFSFKILLALAFMVTTAQAQAQPKQPWHQTAWNQASNFVGTLTTHGFVATYPSSDDTTQTCMASVDHAQMARVFTTYTKNKCVSGDGMVCITQAQYDEYLKQQGCKDLANEITDNIKNVASGIASALNMKASLLFVIIATFVSFCHAFCYNHSKTKSIKVCQDTILVMLPLAHFEIVAKIKTALRGYVCDLAWPKWSWCPDAIIKVVICISGYFLAKELYNFLTGRLEIPKIKVEIIFGTVFIVFGIIFEPDEWSQETGVSILGIILTAFLIWASRLNCLMHWASDMDEYWRLFREDIIAKHLPRFPGEATDEDVTTSPDGCVSDDEEEVEFVVVEDD